MAEILNNNFKFPAISRSGVKLERDYALVDARNKIWELGEQINLYTHTEDTIERDDFGSIVRHIPGVTNTFIFYAFPVMINPTIEQVEKAGLREKTEAIVYTAMLDWWDNNFTMDDLNKLNSIKMQVVIHGEKYEIKDKNLHSDFSDTHLYVVLGLNKI
jgi:hypothetical protein